MPRDAKTRHTYTIIFEVYGDAIPEQVCLRRLLESMLRNLNFRVLKVLATETNADMLVKKSPKT